jgi:hypothetical protein
MLTQLQQNRRIVHDFTVTSLSVIPGLFARLTYVSSLRDLSSGRYEHAGLHAIYPRAAVQQALEICHEELFERLLEMPLRAQQEDLRRCLEGMEGGLNTSVENWQSLESYRVLIPSDAPDYLKTLFCSNLRALLGILQQDIHQPHSVA